MITVTKKFFIPEKNESFYPGEVVELGKDVEDRALVAGRAEKSTATKEKRLTPVEGQKAENDRLKEEKLLEQKGAAQKNVKGEKVTAGKKA